MNKISLISLALSFLFSGFVCLSASEESGNSETNTEQAASEANTEQSTEAKTEDNSDKKEVKKKKKKSKRRGRNQRNVNKGGKYSNNHKNEITDRFNNQIAYGTTAKLK